MSSSKPLQFTRKWYLNQLCIAIFGNVKINYYDDGAIEINNNSGLADKAIFDTIEKMARTRARMEILFYYTFLSESAQFRLTGKQKAFCRNDAIANACEYFRKNCVNISSFASADAMIPSIILKGLNYVLAAIFQADPESDRDYSTEDISSRFREMLSAYKKELYNNLIISGTDIDYCECYYDSMYFDERGYRQDHCISAHLGECNFAIPITFREVFHSPVFQLISVSIPFSPRQKKVVSKEERFQELVTGYIPISPEKHLLLKNHSLYIKIPEMGLPFTQAYTFPTSFPEPHGLDKYVYFLTLLDQSTVESLYSNPKTHAELHQAILKRAQKFMRQQNDTLKHIEAEWCVNVMTVIEITLERVLRLAGYREYLLGVAPDIQRGSEIFSVFDIPENVLDLMHDYHDIDEKWGVIFTAFDWAINAFFSNISKVIDAFSLLDELMGEGIQERNDKPSEIARFIRLNTTEIERLRHIEYIEDILRSEAFHQAIETQRVSPPASVPILQSERNPFCCICYRLPDIFATIKRYIEHYLDQLR